MFPLRDVHRLARAPVVTRLLVLLMAAVFAWQIVLALRQGEGGFITQWGARPRCIVSPDACNINLGAIPVHPASTLRRWLAPLLSSAFLHAGVLHLLLNAWFLWVFGPGVEDRLGRLKYLSFYLACAIASALCHVATQPGSPVPLVGASGAIAGILGAHLILLPRSWILSYIPPIWIVPIPSLVFLLVWMAGQIVGARALLPLELSGMPAPERDIAWAAHIGGFVFGAACAWRAKPWFRKGEDEDDRTRKRGAG